MFCSFFDLKRPFTEEEWKATPKLVCQHIIQLENIVVKLFKKTEGLAHLTISKGLTERKDQFDIGSDNKSPGVFNRFVIGLKNFQMIRCNFYQQFTELIFNHQTSKGLVVTLASNLSSKFESPMVIS